MYLNTVRQIILEGEVADEKCPFGVEKGGGEGGIDCSSPSQKAERRFTFEIAIMPCHSFSNPCTEWTVPAAHLRALLYRKQ